MNAAAGVQRDSTVRPWLLTLALIAAIVTGVHSLRERSKPELFPAMATTEKNSSWYLLLRMPALTSQYESGVSTMRTRYSDWLKNLTRAGYHPVLFSDIYRARLTGTKLPSKAVVLIFDPGYRHTQELLDPILSGLRWPAVWMSDEKAMADRHREFITYHTARRMTDSGLWDVGIKRANGTYTFKVGQKENFTVGNKGNDAWTPDCGGIALNRDFSLEKLNRLNVNSKWTPTDFLNRLAAEIPVEGPSYLTMAPVQNLQWGVVAKANAASPPFKMNVPSERRSTVVSWLGTQGIDNLRADIKGNALTGTLSMRFRWDEPHGNGVQVSISNTAVTVEERIGSQARAVTSVPRKPNSSFSVQSTLVNYHLNLTVDGKTVDVPELRSTAQHEGFTQIHLADQVRDAAQVSDVQFYFEPILAETTSTAQPL